jgi:hypothetical protein
MNVATKLREIKKRAQREIRCLNKNPFLRDVLGKPVGHDKEGLKWEERGLTSTVRLVLPQH